MASLEDDVAVCFEDEGVRRRAGPCLPLERGTRCGVRRVVRVITAGDENEWLVAAQRLAVRRCGRGVSLVEVAEDRLDDVPFAVVERAGLEGAVLDELPGRQWATRASEVPLPVKPGRQPARAGEHTPGIRNIAFAVEDIDAVVAGLRAHGSELVSELERYQDKYRLCYVRGPQGIIVELAERIG